MYHTGRGTVVNLSSYYDCAVLIIRGLPYNVFSKQNVFETEVTLENKIEYVPIIILLRHINI